MPLYPGCSDDVIGDNVAKLVAEGRTVDEATTIAFSYAAEQGCEVPAYLKELQRIYATAIRRTGVQ